MGGAGHEVYLEFSTLLLDERVGHGVLNLLLGWNCSRRRAWNKQPAKGGQKIPKLESLSNWGLDFGTLRTSISQKQILKLLQKFK